MPKATINIKTEAFVLVGKTRSYAFAPQVFQVEMDESLFQIEGREACARVVTRLRGFALDPVEVAE